jgi:hypothetical protein
MSWTAPGFGATASTGPGALSLFARRPTGAPGGRAGTGGPMGAPGGRRTGGPGAARPLSLNWRVRPTASPGSAGRVLPTDRTGRVLPTDRTGRVLPTDRTGRVLPRGRTGRVVPRGRTGRVVPGGAGPLSLDREASLTTFRGGANPTTSCRGTRPSAPGEAGPATSRGGTRPAAPRGGVGRVSSPGGTRPTRGTDAAGGGHGFSWRSSKSTPSGR